MYSFNVSSFQGSIPRLCCLSASLQVNKLSFSLSKDPAHNGHGLIVKLEAQKPSQLEKPLHIALGVDGEEFWRTAARAFGDWTVGLAR